jgi:8-oxo-dGTP pyrophosphatase MutT (NUDIX family)
VCSSDLLVYNAEKDSILFIYRRNKWDLPKGKIDKGEGIQVAALREVEEECGIKSHKIKSFLTDTYHIFNMNNKWYLKKTYWFNMQCSTEEKLIPQAEEDITAIEWVNKNDLSKIKSNTYAMITDILNDL